MTFPVFRSAGVLTGFAALLLGGAAAGDARVSDLDGHPDEVRVGKRWLPVEEAEAARDEEELAKGAVYYGTGWIPQAGAERLRRVDRKRVGWAFETRSDSAHVSVYSSLPVAFTRRLAAVLENGIGAYRDLYGPIWRLAPLPKSLRVFLFSDRDAFQSAVRAAGEVPDGGDTCRYCPQAQLVCVLGDTGNGFETLVDALRTLNTALDTLLAPGEMPVWAQRGRGLYLALGLQGRQVLPGFLAPLPAGAASALLEEDMGLAELISSGGSAFYSEKRTGREFLAWAWVHFLLHGEGGRHAAGFRTYLSGKAAKGMVADFERAVGKVRDLEPGFRRDVSEVLVPGAKKKVT